MRIAVTLALVAGQYRLLAPPGDVAENKDAYRAAIVAGGKLPDGARAEQICYFSSSGEFRRKKLGGPAVQTSGLDAAEGAPESEAPPIPEAPAATELEPLAAAFTAEAPAEAPNQEATTEPAKARKSGKPAKAGKSKPGR